MPKTMTDSEELTSERSLVRELSAVDHSCDVVSDLPFTIRKVLAELNDDTRVVASDDDVGRAQECRVLPV
jgi:hypothetical protein